MIDEAVDGVIGGVGDANAAGANYTYDGAGRLIDAYSPGHRYSYNFGAPSALDCPSGSPVNASLTANRNSNRSAVTDQPTLSGPAAVTKSCYDAADRLTSSTAAGIGTTVGYDSRGRTVTLGAESNVYDQSDRHVSSATSTVTVGYVRDAVDRIIARKLNGTITACYAYTGGGDTPDQTLVPSGSACSATVAETVRGLPGGATVTSRGSAATDVWSLANVHGDTLAVVNGNGVKQGATFTYSPDGQALNGLVDNSVGNFDNAWLGSYQRPLEHEPGLFHTIEMGARPYNLATGRFLTIDPIEGGTANDYTYVNDPINDLDLNGLCSWFNAWCHGQNLTSKISKTMHGKKGGFTLRGSLRGMANAAAVAGIVLLTMGTGGAGLALVMASSAVLSVGAFGVSAFQGKCRSPSQQAECAGDLFSAAAAGIPVGKVGSPRVSVGAVSVGRRLHAAPCLGF